MIDTILIEPSAKRLAGRDGLAGTEAESLFSAADTHPGETPK